MIKKKIIEFLDFKGISKYKFYQDTGISNGFLDKEGAIGSDKCEIISSHYPELNIEWLITDKGPMIKPIEGTSLVQVNEDNFDYLQTHGIPLIPISSMAGIGGNGDMRVLPHDIEDYFVIPRLKGIANCAFQVYGDSMAPTYLSGDYVLCRRQPLEPTYLEWKMAYVLDTSRGSLVKRVQPGPSADVLTLVSDNTFYDPFHLQIDKIRAMAIILAVVRMV